MKEYFNRFDTIRVTAFLIVFVSHITYFLRTPASVTNGQGPLRALLQNGDLGVSLFFVLSGFLITFLLEKEYQKNGTISFRKFYTRRILRIWPLYFLAIAIILLLSVALPHFRDYQIGVNKNEVTAFLLLVGNIYRSFWGTSNDVLTILWSVCVEEQFYLIWPLLFFLFRKRIWIVISLGVIVSLAFNYHYSYRFEPREFYTPCVMIYLMMGALAGIYAPRFKEFFRGFGFPIILVGTFLSALLAYGRWMLAEQYSGTFAAFQAFAFSFLFALIIAASAYFPYRKTFFNSITEYLGRISYGLYVFHLIALTLILGFIYTAPIGNGMTIPLFFLLFVVILLLTVALASLSHFYFERPFLKLKDRFENI